MGIDLGKAKIDVGQSLKPTQGFFRGELPSPYFLQKPSKILLIYVSPP